ncbi:MAG: hypothetical protein QW472_02985 [Candidatus Aenigmatarchaeota archaeon]
MMRKGQSVVIQFLIFFMIGFSIFVSLGSFFRYQADILRQEILSSSVNLTSSYISSAVISILDSCKGCDFVSLSVVIYNTSAGYPLLITTQDSKLNISTFGTSHLTTIHNISKNPITLTGYSVSSKPIILTFNKSNNNLRVS